MRVYGIELHQGSVISNANIESASILPLSGTSRGQLFFRTADDTLHVRNSANTEWLPLHIKNLEDLDDVSIDGAIHGQSLVFDELDEKWKPVTISSDLETIVLNDITDVDVSDSTNDGWILSYNESTEKWEGIEETNYLSVLTNNVLVDGTFSHDDGNGTIVVVSLRARNLPFEDNTGGSPILYAENVKDAILEVKDLAITSTAVSSVVDSLSVNGTVSHNDGAGEGIVIDFNPQNIPFATALSPAYLQSDNVRDAIDEVYQIVDNKVIEEDTTFYIASDGHDVTGDGTSGTPWASPHKALDFLNDKLFSEGIKITIQCTGGDYTFTEPMIVRHSQGSQIELIGASLLGNKPKKFKLPDFTDPLNPIQDARDVDDIHATMAALPIDADDTTREAAADDDVSNNNILLHERFSTRFLFTDCSAIQFENGCGLNLVDNILFEGNHSIYYIDGVLVLPEYSFLEIGENVAFANFFTSFVFCQGGTLVINEPLILNMYGGITVSNNGNCTFKGLTAGSFTDSSDVPSGIIHYGNNPEARQISNSSSSIKLSNMSFIGGTDSGNMAVGGRINFNGCCFVGTELTGDDDKLFQVMEGGHIELSSNETMITGINDGYLFHAENGNINTYDDGNPTINIKGCNSVIAYVYSNSLLRLKSPTLTNNVITEMYCNYDSTIQPIGNWSIDDTNTGIALNVSQGGRIIINEPGTGNISANAALSTIWGRMTYDGSFIGDTNLLSSNKKWILAENDITVVNGDKILVNAENNDVIITLPITPKNDDEIRVKLIRNNGGSPMNILYIDPSSELINDAAGISDVASVLYKDITLVYHTYGWWA